MLLGMRARRDPRGREDQKRKRVLLLSFGDPRADSVEVQHVRAIKGPDLALSL
jgi:hypothetical protein